MASTQAPERRTPSARSTGAEPSGRRPWRRHRVLDQVAAAPRRRRRRLIVVGVLLAILVAALVWLVWFSSVLTVTSVRVVGAEGQAADQVLQSAAIAVNVPLARVDTDAASARVHELGWVGQAEVRRGWPHEIVIAIEPRIPIAVLETSPTSGVDAEGVAFDTGLAAAELRGLPQVAAEGPALAESMAVLQSLPADLQRKVASLSASTPDSVELNLRSGHLVRWGSAEQPEQKAAVLRVLMQRKGDVFDVTAPDAPTVYRG